MTISSAPRFLALLALLAGACADAVIAGDADGGIVGGSERSTAESTPYGPGAASVGPAPGKSVGTGLDVVTTTAFPGVACGRNRYHAVAAMTMASASVTTSHPAAPIRRSRSGSAASSEAASGEAPPRSCSAFFSADRM